MNSMAYASGCGMCVVSAHVYAGGLHQLVELVDGMQRGVDVHDRLQVIGVI
jgi:hypothetical protein